MKFDRPVFLKFRNDMGEVQVCLSAVASNLLMAGFSCCNPKDMHLTRSRRVLQHQTVSAGRMEKKPVEIELPQGLDAVPEDRRYEFVRAAVINYMRDFGDHNLGLRRYTGDPEKCEFHNWFSRFYTKLVTND